MEKKIQNWLLIVILIISLSVSAILIALGFALKNRQENPDLWVLHSYGNNVALYNGDEIIEVYGFSVHEKVFQLFAGLFIGYRLDPAHKMICVFMI